MSNRPKTLAELFQQSQNTPPAQLQTPNPKQGEQLFEMDVKAPKDFESFTGQKVAIQMLKAIVADSKETQRVPGHILLASGLPGIGKSALARLTAYQLSYPMIETQGKVTKAEAIAICEKLSTIAPQGAILFLDEVHQVFAQRKEEGEWLLSLMQDKRILTSEGEHVFPNITILAATTDKQTIPEAVLSRFTWTPPLVEYSDDEAAIIAEQSSELTLTPIDYKRIARAAACNPRTLKKILNNVRVCVNAGLSTPDDDGNLNLSTPLEWAQVDENGLTLTARKIYAILYTKGAVGERGYGMKNIAAELGEPVYPERDEALLKRIGWLTVTSAGRSLTQEGVDSRNQVRL